MIQPNDDYRRALNAVPAQPVAAIPGLPDGEWAVPALWAIQQHTSALLPPTIAPDGTVPDWER